MGGGSLSYHDGKTVFAWLRLEPYVEPSGTEGVAVVFDELLNGEGFVFQL